MELTCKGCESSSFTIENKMGTKDDGKTWAGTFLSCNNCSELFTYSYSEWED